MTPAAFTSTWPPLRTPLGASTSPAISRPPSPAVTWHVSPFGSGASAWQLVVTISFLQAAEHPSPSTLLPSSHCSPGSRLPSPHVGRTSSLQAAEHPSPSTLLPSSHSSPASRLPSPHVGEISFLQVAEQPSP